jgi:hypothetical protein
VTAINANSGNSRSIVRKSQVGLYVSRVTARLTKLTGVVEGRGKKGEGGVGVGGWGGERNRQR